MKKILIMATALDIGGVQKSLLSLLQVLDYNEFSVDLLLLNEEGDFMPFLPPEVKIISFPSGYKWVYLPRGQVLSSFRKSIGLNLNVFRYVFYLLKGMIIGNVGKARQQLMRACTHTLPEIPERYDVAIDYTGGHKGYILSKTYAQLKISWVHGDYRVFSRDREIDLNDYGQLDAIVTISETCLQIIKDQFPQLHEKCYLIPNIISKQTIRKMASESVNDMKDEDGTIQILDITRLDPDKGLELAIEACKLLIIRGHRVHWYILGDGPEKQRLEKVINDQELGNNFTLLGARSNPYPYIRTADIVVHCSKFEGRSVAIDEAMMLAKPIILTNYPTAKDQIDSEINGLICDMSSEGICNAIERLISQPDLAKTFETKLEGFDISPDISISIFMRLLDRVK